jgi:putative tryptophan/tyrosine transport system substrate-binding protein
MRRREFIIVLASAAAACSVDVSAQQVEAPTIGFLSTRSAGDSGALVAAVRNGLSDTGYVEGVNLRIDYLWADGNYDKLPGLAAELSSRPVVAIIASGGSGAAMAAKAATSTIPIIFTVGTDPVEEGLVASFAHPGANLTGVTLITSELGAKRLGVLREMVPTDALIAVVLNSRNPGSGSVLKNMQAAARSVGQEILLLNATNERELEHVFSVLVSRRVEGLVMMPDPFFNAHRDRIVHLAAHQAIPTIYDSREFAVAGGLMSYGPNYSDAYRQTGIYAGRVLRGAKPADLPVEQPTKFELVINLKTAKALGLTIPPTLLARADEVIE